MGRHRHGDVEEHTKGRPVLVGTVSIEKSERLVARAEEARRREARRPQREVSRAGSGVVAQAGRKGGDDRHQHGRSRHRHSARRQSRVHGPAGVPEERIAEKSPARGRGSASSTTQHRYFFYGTRTGFRPRLERTSLGTSRPPTPSTTRSSRSAACTSLAPSVTRRDASTTSCAAAPAVRATRARRASTCRCRTT